MKLLRTIQLDASDRFVFEHPAEPGEWAVSGAFAFLGADVRALQGKPRTAFRAGFLGVSSLGRSTLAQVVNVSKQDHAAVVEMLAGRLVEYFSAPDLAVATNAAEEEISFVASLCDHPPGVIIAVTRTFESGVIREAFRTLRPGVQTPSSAFQFIEVVGEDVPDEHVDLARLIGEKP
ncbi:hypothetical protein V1291_003966 [Nitrobacteraceae bacterium AZCC 1564]